MGFNTLTIAPELCFLRNGSIVYSYILRVRWWCYCVLCARKHYYARREYIFDIIFQHRASQGFWVCFTALTMDDKWRTTETQCGYRPALFKSTIKVWKISTIKYILHDCVPCRLVLAIFLTLLPFGEIFDRSGSFVDGWEEEQDTPVLTVMITDIFV